MGAAQERFLFSTSEVVETVKDYKVTCSRARRERSDSDVEG